MTIFSNKKALLLDMNSTFMFGEDNFDVTEDFSKYYHEIGGTRLKAEINQIIRAIYLYLDVRYPDEQYRHNFPSIEYAILTLFADEFNQGEIIDTFSYHEIGYVSDTYIKVLHELNQKFQLSVVIDIWAPKDAWLRLFEASGISALFQASSFSSDHGIVKPSPKPFELVIEALGIKKEEALVVGDSIRRDLGGAQAAGIDCVLVGGATDEHAAGCYENLITFSQSI